MRIVSRRNTLDIADSTCLRNGLHDPAPPQNLLVDAQYGDQAWRLLEPVNASALPFIRMSGPTFPARRRFQPAAYAISCRTSTASRFSWKRANL